MRICRRKNKKLSWIPAEVRIAAAATERPAETIGAILQAHYDADDDIYAASQDIFQRASLLHRRVMQKEDDCAISNFVRMCDEILCMKNSRNNNKFERLLAAARRLTEPAIEIDSAMLAQRVELAPRFANESLRAHVPYARAASSPTTHADHIIEFQFVNVVLSAALFMSTQLKLDEKGDIDFEITSARFPWISALVTALSRSEFVAPMDAKLNQAKRGAWKAFINRLFVAPGLSLEQAAATSSSAQSQRLIDFFSAHMRNIEMALVSIMRDAAAHVSRDPRARSDVTSRTSLAYVLCAFCIASQQALGNHRAVLPKPASLIAQYYIVCMFVCACVVLCLYVCMII